MQPFPDIKPRLQPALRGGRDALSPAALHEVMALAGPRPARFLITAGLAWLVIGAAVAIAQASHSVWISLIAMAVIASRQNTLGLLVHEQTHMGLGNGRWSDTVANVLCGYPLMVLSVEGYAQVHLAHHRDDFQPGDPDFFRKSGAEWAVPKQGRELARLFLGDLLMLNTWRLIRGKRAAGPGIVAFQRRHPTPKWVRLAMMVALAAALTWSGTWAAFGLYWMLPLLLLLPLFVRWGALCEHEYNQPGATMQATTPLIVQPWWERALAPYLNFGMHPYHHLFPAIGFSRLPAVHAIFQREGLVHEDRVFRESLAYLRFVLGRPHGQPTGSLSATTR